FDFQGTLALYKKADGAAGLVFKPAHATLSLPLPPNASLDLAFGEISILHGSAGAPGSPRSAWAFAAAVNLSIHGWHKDVQKALPDPIRTTFRADQESVSLTADKLIAPFDFDIPDIEIDSNTRVRLGRARIEASNLTIRLGADIALSAQIGVGLPAEF